MCGSNSPVVYLFDILTLSIPVFARETKDIFADANITKWMFDCRRDVEALSCQMGLVPAGVIDLQLYDTALQWKSKSVSRRSSLNYVLKRVANIDRHDGDSAVHAAMTLGHRPVWDVRPLPPHFIQYAADDVRHILLIAPGLMKSG